MSVDKFVLFYFLSLYFFNFHSFHVCDFAEVLVCSIAKVKTSNWEELLNALPLSHRAVNKESGPKSKNVIIPTAPSGSSKSSAKQSFRGKRNTRIKK